MLAPPQKLDTDTRQERQPDSGTSDTGQEAHAGAHVCALRLPVKQNEGTESAGDTAYEADLEGPQDVLPGGPEQHERSG